MASSTASSTNAHPSGLDVVELCRDLIRIDTSNYGDVEGPGERKAAEYVATVLSNLGLEPVIRESAPGRASLTCLWPGVDRDRPPLVVHGHLDVVPAFKEDWSVDPFAGEVRNGMVWGRGAVDMKDMDAMILATVSQMVAVGAKPARDIVLAFFADEEHGGRMGAGFMAAHHRDDFRGANEAISEVGGYSTVVNGRRTYLIQTAEKGIHWLKLIAGGKQGHGSLINADNAVTHLAAALTRIGTHSWPLEVTPTVDQLLRGVSDLTGLPYSKDETSVAELIAALGPAARFVEATVRNTANPTVMDAGYKTNVIPDTANAIVDVRYLHGQEESIIREIEALAGPHVKVEQYISQKSLELPFEVELIDKMTAALASEDPDATVLPYALSGGTDNKHLSDIGIAGYGFAPLLLPPDLDFVSLFHGIDERVPIDGMHFGVRVLQKFFANC